jgi:uncharacterized protein
MDFYPRAMEQVIRRAWASQPVVVLEGPRASGKTRLAEMIVGSERLYRLDDSSVLDVAQASPRAWVESLPPGSAIDEAQLLPGVSVEAKRIADVTGEPGRLLLTGSHRLSRTELGGSDPLAGRVRRLQLLPLLQSELGAEPRDFVRALFDSDPALWRVSATTQSEMKQRMMTGGFPTAQRIAKRELNDWGVDYASSIIGSSKTGRDVSRFLRLFRWLAATSGTPQNISNFGRANDLDNKTVSRYLSELQEMFLVFDVPALVTIDKREIKAPRLFVVDPLLASARLVEGPATPEEGSIFETFVACELKRLLNVSSTRANLLWWKLPDADRKASGANEVDLVLEHEDGRIVAIEVKSARESKAEHFNAIRAMRQRYGDRFHRGVVLHCGTQSIRHEESLWAMPFSALWEVGEPFDSSSPTGRSALAVAVSRVVASDNEVDGRTRLVSEHILNLAEPTLSLVRDYLATVGVETTAPTVSNDSTWLTLPRKGGDSFAPKLVLGIKATANGGWEWFAALSHGRTETLEIRISDLRDLTEQRAAMDQVLAWIAEHFEAIVAFARS